MMTFGKIGTKPLFKHWTARDYVQDGLVAMWDSIENAGWGVHNAETTTWKDLIGTSDAVLQSALSANRTWGDDYFYNNVESAVFIGTPSSALQTAIASGNLTVQGLFVIEAVPSSGNFCVLQCSPPSTTTDALIYCSINKIGSSSGNTMSWANNRAGNNFPGGWTDVLNNPLSISFICNSSAGTMTSILNGSAGSVSISQPIPTISDLTSFAIGSYNWNAGRSRTLLGRMYGFRIYSRVLNTTEIAYNYNIDNLRFNLP